MNNRTHKWGTALVCGALMLWGGNVHATDSPVTVAGTWEMAVETDQGTFNNTLTLTQDGGKIKGVLKSQFGESAFEGTVTGNKISFNVKFDTPNGSFLVDHTGTVDGDSMSGTAHNDQFDAKWTAKRSKAPDGK